MERSSGKERQPEGEPAGDAVPATDEERWAHTLAHAPAFGEAVGRQLQRVREDEGRTAEDVAQTAQQFGLLWHRPTVGQIERGRRALSAVELIALPAIYGRPLGELLPEGTVWLTSKLGVYDREVRRVLGGSYNPSFRALHAPGGWHLKGTSDQDPKQVAQDVAQVVARWSAPWPPGGKLRYMLDRPDDAETKAAKRLGTTPHYVAYAARETWGHGLAAEREARLRQRDDLPEGKRALQSARGHITRTLVAELEPVIKAYGKPESPVDPAELGPMTTTKQEGKTDG